MTLTQTALVLVVLIIEHIDIYNEMRKIDIIYYFVGIKKTFQRFCFRFHFIANNFFVCNFNRLLFTFNAIKNATRGKYIFFLYATFYVDI